MKFVTCAVELPVPLEEMSCRRELNSRDSSSAVAKDAFRSSVMDWTTDKRNTDSQIQWCLNYTAHRPLVAHHPIFGDYMTPVHIWISIRKNWIRAV